MAVYRQPEQKESTRGELFAALDQLITETLSLDPGAVEISLGIDLGSFDSIDLLDIVSTVEDRYDLDFSRDELARIVCKEDLYNLVFRKAVLERRPVDGDLLAAAAVVIPVYNHAPGLMAVLEQATRLGAPVIVVDDGSTDGAGDVAARFEGVTVLRHPENLGKGAALRTGMAAAAKTARWAITLDADGQHEPLEATRLMAALPPDGPGIVIGMREGMDGPAVPWTSSFGRSFSNFWVWLSGGPWLPDTQSGFRVYPLPETLNLGASSDRFQYEVELLARAGWHRMPVVSTPVSVNYRPGKHRISHFRPLLDFLRNGAIFSRLIAMRVLIPRGLRTRRARGA